MICLVVACWLWLHLRLMRSPGAEWPSDTCRRSSSVFEKPCWGCFLVLEIYLCPDSLCWSNNIVERYGSDLNIQEKESSSYPRVSFFFVVTFLPRSKAEAFPISAWVCSQQFLASWWPIFPSAASLWDGWSNKLSHCCAKELRGTMVPMLEISWLQYWAWLLFAWSEHRFSQIHVILVSTMYLGVKKGCVPRESRNKTFIHAPNIIE